jgi:hypothetical protein
MSAIKEIGDRNLDWQTSETNWEDTDKYWNMI